MASSVRMLRPRTIVGNFVRFVIWIYRKAPWGLHPFIPTQHGQVAYWPEAEVVLPGRVRNPRWGIEQQPLCYALFCYLCRTLRILPSSFAISTFATEPNV